MGLPVAAAEAVAATTVAAAAGIRLPSYDYHAIIIRWDKEQKVEQGAFEVRPSHGILVDNGGEISNSTIVAILAVNLQNVQRI